MDMVNLTLSTGLGVSVLAGILSGVCYVLAHGIKNKRNRKIENKFNCQICGEKFQTSQGILNANRFVTCKKCRAKICKSNCANLNHEGNWICMVCAKPLESWLKGILNAIQPNSKVFFKTSFKMDSETINESDEDIEAKRLQQKQQVRDFIERLVNAMLGEDVDDASVSKIYMDDNYLPVSGESPCTAHAALKQLIKRLIQEAVNLPQLREADHPALPLDESNRTYEDLLATAILNKVISSCQNDNVPSSSRNSSRQSNHSRHRGANDKEYFFGEETLDSKWKTTDLDTTSISSVDDLLSDSSLGSKKFVDRRTLTIKHNIEEVYQTDSENDEDEVDGPENSTLLTEDDSNWFLQKRQFQGTHSPVPVPMLVPNPTHEAKVLIGDKEVEDTSDLSEVESDYGETEPTQDVKNLLLESKTVIGGRNPLESLQNGNISDGETSADSGVKEETEFVDEVLQVNKTDITVDDDNVEDASILSVYSNTEQDTEYTEKYASLPRTIIKPEDNSTQVELEINNEEINNNNNIDEVEDEIETQTPFTGNYSRKEKEKWLHAVEMENNPYTTENIEKRRREQQRNSLQTLFGPDYYAKQASKPSGTKSKLTFPKEDEVVHSATPAIVISEDDKEQEEDIEPIVVDTKLPCLEETEQDSPDQTISEITSDSDVSYINCYDVKNGNITKTPSEIERTKNHDENDNVINEYKEYIPRHNFLSRDESIEEEDESCFVPTNHEINNEIIPPQEFRSKSISPPHSSQEDLISEEPLKLNQSKSYNTEVGLSSSNDELDNDTFTDKVVTKKQPQPRLHRFMSEGHSNETPTVLSKKRDNSLISKIYQQPNVKNFALKNREYIPEQPLSEPPRPQYKPQFSVDVSLLNSPAPVLRKSTLTSSQEDLLSDNSQGLEEYSKINSYLSSSNDDLLSLENEIPITKEKSIPKTKAAEADPVINKLQKGKLVENITKQFTESYPQLKEKRLSKHEDEKRVKDEENIEVVKSTKVSENDTEVIKISVKELMKKFQSDNNHVDRPISSLTARSLPKATIERLRK